MVRKKYSEIKKIVREKGARGKVIVRVKDSERER